MRTRIICAMLLAAVAPALLVADGFNKAGRTAMQFVKIGVGARQTAMGEAGLSVVRDVNAIFWNPAGLTGVSAREASFSYNRWFADLNYLAGAVAFRVEDVGVFGLSATSLDYGDIPESIVRTTSGSSDTRTGGTFTGGDLMLALTFSREFTDRLSIGASVKYLREKLFTYSTDVVAVDLGTCFDTGFRGIRFAMAVQNLEFGNSARFLETNLNEEGYDIPLVFRIGTSIDLIHEGDAFVDLGKDHSLTVAFEAINTNDFGERYHVGGEYTFMGFLALRAGYRFRYDEGEASFGFGLAQEIAGMGVRLDYSFVRYTYLTSPHRVTLSLAF